MIKSNRIESNRIEYKKSIKTTTQKTLSVITLDEDKLFIINKYNVKSRALLSPFHQYQSIIIIISSSSISSERYRVVRERRDVIS